MALAACAVGGVGGGGGASGHVCRCVAGAAAEEVKG